MNLNELKPVGILSPFKNFCVSIGEYPSAYMNSKSYYEMLVWFCKYLEERVIPAVNRNASATVELQEKYVELKNYVDNYFINLNVQEEINNKLDSMVLDGTLTSLIGNYVNPYITQQNQRITNFENTVNSNMQNYQNQTNNRYNNLETQIQGLGNGSPIPVSSTSGMTDTSKIYVNTTDGKWYYFDGTNWTIGGTYQGTSLQENEVAFENLNFDLQNETNKHTFNKYHYPKDVMYGYYVRRYRDVLQTNSNYFLLKIDVSTSAKVVEIDYKKFKTIYPSGTLVQLGAYITHTEETQNIQSEFKFFQINFTANATNNYNKTLPMLNPFLGNNDKYYYIVQSQECDFFALNLKEENYDISEMVQVYDINDFFNEVLLKKTIDINKSIINYETKDLINDCVNVNGIIQDSQQAAGFMITNLNDENRNTIFHKITNYDTYIYFKYLTGSYNFSIFTYNKDFEFVRQITTRTDCVLNGESYKYVHIEKGETEEYIGFTSKMITNTSLSYEVKAHILHSLENELYIETIDGLEIKAINDVNYFKNWYAIGDSITEKNFRANKNYIDYCKEDFKLGNIINLGVSGSGYIRSSSQNGNQFYKRIAQIPNTFDIENDIITVMGSINDISFVSENLGQITDTTIDTVYGAMNLFFSTLITKFTGCRVGIIEPTPR